MTMTELYDERFYDWVNLTSRRSAEIILPLVHTMTQPRSVVDVGCGECVWLSVWSDLGAPDLLGLDGPHVRADRLAVCPDQFFPTNLVEPFAISRRFDLAQSLEVGEHLPQSVADGFVDGLCALSDIVFFSAAVPGQGGEMHVNEQPPSWWARKFAARGYAAFDPLRPQLHGRTDIAPWYRFNSIIYANEAGVRRLSAQALSARIADPDDLDGGGDALWRLRCALLAPLPEPLVTRLSRLRYRMTCALTRRAA